MSVTITYHGHACFGVQTARASLLIDPFLSGNPQADVTAEDVNPDYLLVTHAHSDHLGDALAIALRTGATVICNFEIANKLSESGAKVHAMHIGGAHRFPFGVVKLTIAHHGSSFADGSYGGSPCGFLLWLDGRVVYHAGDTALTYDMTLYGAEGIDVAILPIGDNFTMGPEDAVKAVGFLQPRVAVLMHYDTFDAIAQDAAKVAQQIGTQTAARPLLMSPGERYEVE